MRKEQRKQTIEKDPGVYSSLLVGGKDGSSVLDKASKRTDILQYILVLATDLITGQTMSMTASLLLIDNRCDPSCDDNTRGIGSL